MSFIYPWLLSLIIPISIYIWQKGKKSITQKLHLIALLLLIIAISRPVIKDKNQKERFKIGSVIIALDISASMRANDIKPNRLLASKETIQLFLKRNKKNQIALIAFSSNPLLISPLSRDTNLILSSLKALNEKYILTKGTDIKKLLYKVAKFPISQKLLIIFSDGGDKIIDNKLIKFIRDNNIKILTIAMATQRGSTIQIDNQLLKDKNGHIVISTLNNQIYKMGDVIKFSTPTETTSKIESWIDKEISKNISKKYSTKYYELFWVPTLLALILIFFAETKFISKLIWLLMILGIDANGAILDDYYLYKAYKLYKSGEYNHTIELLSKIEKQSLEREMIKSNSYYKLKNYQKAKEILLSIKTTNPQIKHKLLYNLGNCEAKLLHYNKAKEYYIKALEIKEDRDALHNLKVVIFLKESKKIKFGKTNPDSQGSSKNSNLKNSNSKKQNSKNQKESSSQGGNSKTQQTSINTKRTTNQDNNSKKKFSSKAYELINKGYINEDTPW